MKQEYRYKEEFLQIKTTDGWKAVGCMNWETQCHIRCAALDLNMVEGTVYLRCCDKTINIGKGK